MKLTNRLPVLNQKFNKLNMIRDVMKNRRLATQTLQDDYRKIYKNHQFTY